MTRYFVWAAVVVAGALLAVADWRWIKRPVFGALSVHRGKTHICDVALACRSRQAEPSIVSEIQRVAAARQFQRR
jgi:hypothetical protein